MKKKVTAGTLARTVILAVALLNQFLTIFGYSPIPVNEEQVELFISFAFTGFAALLTWWKNNSFTQLAIASDEEMKAKKKELK